MTQEQIEKVNSKANELAKELWNSEHLECFGNLEIKLQEIVENLTIPVVRHSNFTPIDREKPHAYREDVRWDGKRTDMLIFQLENGECEIGTMYKGYMDGSEFEDYCTKNDDIINEKVVGWAELPR
jgi:hypothetical protein